MKKFLLSIIALLFFLPMLVRAETVEIGQQSTQTSQPPNAQILTTSQVATTVQVAPVVQTTAAQEVSIATASEASSFSTAIISGVSGTSLKIYDEAGTDFSITSGVGDDAVSMPGYFFPDGHYTVINTSDSAACGVLSLDECRKNAGFIGATSFEVASGTVSVDALPTSSTPTPQPAPAVSPAALPPVQDQTIPAVNPALTPAPTPIPTPPVTAAVDSVPVPNPVPPADTTDTTLAVPAASPANIASPVQDTASTPQDAAPSTQSATPVPQDAAPILQDSTPVPKPAAPVDSTDSTPTSSTPTPPSPSAQ